MTQFGIHLPTLLSIDRICNLIKYSKLCAGIGGYMAEFGVYTGGSLEILARHNATTDIFGIDSFAGVPKETEGIDFHREGDFSEGVNYHKIAGYFGMIYPHVRIVKGFAPEVWSYFNETVKFSFVHIDADMYKSILDALEFFMPRMLAGGIILLDDYKVNSTPGCEKAIEDFFEKTTIEIIAHREELFYWTDTEGEAPCHIATPKSHHQYLIVAK